EVASRQLGIMYSGAYAKDEDCFIAYNMHWLAHSFALPSLPKKRKWYQAVHTGSQGMGGLMPVENQKEVILKERTIIILIG
ncbi:MAG: glycogen debranching protein, partial [Lachnospiraceae bacterium]